MAIKTDGVLDAAEKKKLFLLGIFFVENGDRLDAYYFMESTLYKLWEIR